MERERYAATLMVLLLVVLWLGFSVHASPRFPGSLAGGMLALSAAALMVLVPAAYAAVKRIPSLRRLVTRRIAMRTLLTWHVYTGIAGAILALLHSAHKFDSPLGIALTTTMLLTVLTGYIGRHFLGFVSLELHEKQTWLAQLRTAYDELAEDVATRTDPLLGLAASRRTRMRLASLLVTETAVADETRTSPGARAIRLADSIADVEYAITAHELLRGRASRWLKLHLLTSIVFYLLLALHVWASIYFGLRWWP